MSHPNSNETNLENNHLLIMDTGQLLYYEFSMPFLYVKPLL